MPVFIELTSEPFESNMRGLSRALGGSLNGGTTVSSRAGLSGARRPLRGIEIKEDVYAMIQVIRSDGQAIPLVDQGTASGVGDSTASFMLQSVQEARMEKHQIIETFGEPYIYFFGESPRFLDVQAVLVNSNDFNWEAEWWDNWENRLRGTKTVEQGARTYLFYDDTIVEGYMLMASAVKTSDQPWTVQLTWRMFVTNYRNVSFVGDPNFPIHASVELPANVDLTSADAFDQLVTLYANDSRGAQARAITDQHIHDAAQQAGTQNVPNSFGVSLGPGGVTTGPLQQATVPPAFGGIRKLSDLVRTGIRSTAFAPDVGLLIASLSDQDPSTREALKVFNTLSTRPLRGKVIDNTDEWTGNSPAFDTTPSDGLPDVFTPTWRSVQESQNLFLDAIRWMSCFGADVNNYSGLGSLGLKVSFTARAGIGIGSGARGAASIGATFGPRFSTSGVSTSPGGTASGFQVGSGFGDLVPSPQWGFGPAQPLPGQQSQAPNDLFFGSGARAGTTVGLDGVSGGYEYGYTSPFGGPGYGAAGFGDQEGLGYGGGFGAQGDPGHLPPGRFTFAGVEDDQSAFERFVKPSSPQGSGLGGAGLGVSVHGNVGIGASISVGGRPSAFGMTACPGDLNPYGTCGQPGGLAGGPLGLRAGVSVGVGLGVGISAGARAGVRI